MRAPHKVGAKTIYPPLVKALCKSTENSSIHDAFKGKVHAACQSDEKFVDDATAWQRDKIKVRAAGVKTWQQLIELMKQTDVAVYEKVVLLDICSSLWLTGDDDC